MELYTDYAATIKTAASGGEVMIKGIQDQSVNPNLKTRTSGMG
jgi:hypothetical protein